MSCFEMGRLWWARKIFPTNAIAPWRDFLDICEQMLSFLGCFRIHGRSKDNTTSCPTIISQIWNNNSTTIQSVNHCP